MTTTFTLDTVQSKILFLLVIFSPLIIYIFRCVYLNIIEKDKSRWEITTARLTGKTDTYMEVVVRDGFFRVPRRNTDFQIVYTVDGVKYTKYISPDKTGGRKHGKVRIRYLKKRPSTFRVL